MRFVAAMLLTAAACSDGGGPTCSGPGDAGASGVTASTPSLTATYGAFRWGAKGDCPASGSTVVSVTIVGVEVGTTTFGIGMCLPRPDVIGSTPVSLADTNLIHLENVSGMAGGCTFDIGDTPPSGTVTFAGFCGQAGTSFAMTFAGSVPVHVTCADVQTDATATLAGTVAVTPG